MLCPLLKQLDRYESRFLWAAKLYVLCVTTSGREAPAGTRYLRLQEDRSQKTTSVLSFMYSGNIDWKLSRRLIPYSLTGAALGTFALQAVPSAFLKPMIVVLLLAVTITCSANIVQITHVSCIHIQPIKSEQFQIVSYNLSLNWRASQISCIGPTWSWSLNF